MKYTAVMLVLLLMACGGGSSLDEKKAELKKLKKEAAALDKEIAALQLEIIRSDSSLKTADIKVRVNEIRPGLFQHFLNVDGVVKTDEDVMVNPEFQGRIEQLFVTEGTSVSKGQILAKISTDVLVEQLNELKTRYELARTVFEKQSRLWAQKIGSEMQYLQAKSNKEALEKSIARISKQLNLAKITSPINGTVETVFVKKGAYASPMQPFARIVNMDRSYV
ncbi:MAG: efflux RND transporter periplasmic adaptor subunit, partial [Flavobacteriales bacterium]